MRKPIVIISCCIAALLVGYSGYRSYQVWKQSHLLTMARSFAARSDAANEALCLQQALHLNPQNVDACRIMADLADTTHSDGALFWRERVLKLNPKSLPDRLALTQTALSVSDYLTASNALAGVDADGQKTALYQNVAGVVAASVGRLAEAELHFTEAVRLEPDNPTPQLNLAVLLLHSSNTLEVAEARTSLRQISQSSTNLEVRSQAQRELVMDALHRDDIHTALVFAEELAQPTNAIFSDRLLRLETLLQAKSPEYRPVLAAYEREAAISPTKLSDMAAWLMRRATPTEALSWLQSLPPSVQTNQPAAFLVAQCLLQLCDWHGLQSTIQNENWNDLEFVRHMFLARTLREQGLTEASADEWVVALKFTSDQKGPLVSLFQLAAGWNWNSEAEQTLWIVVNKYPEEQWAPPALTHALIAGGRTRPLLELFGIMAKRFPSDIEMKNNVAFVALLLNAQELDPYDLASEVYQKAPQNPSYAATYAFSLYLQGKYSEALKVMQQIAPKELQNPSVAGYYGIILKANGNPESARAYLKLTAKAQLLPEEQALFQQAMMN
jgi:cytochrome c-type biogenesis protein CcmH/NrfG